MVHPLTPHGRFSPRTLVAAAIFLLIGLATPAVVKADNSYGSGTYGSCQYNSCGISLSSNGTVSADVTPGAGTTCSVASDSASVLTDSSTGYTLTLSDGDTANQMAGAAHGGSIAATTGTAGSPAALAAGKWGYRVDGAAGFGSGPTSSLSNGSVPSVAFAAVPPSSGAADTLASTAGPADPAVTTTVWYGVCVNASTVGDTYTDSVVYTAVVN